MVEAVVAILCGVLLLAPRIRGGSAGRRVVGPLVPFEAVIGIFALVVGLLNITSVVGITLVAGGLVLASSAVAQVPRIGGQLQRAGRWLGGVRMVLGMLLLLLGVLSLLGALGRGPAGAPPGWRWRG